MTVQLDLGLVYKTLVIGQIVVTVGYYIENLIGQGLKVKCRGTVVKTATGGGFLSASRVLRI